MLAATKYGSSLQDKPNGNFSKTYAMLPAAVRKSSTDMILDCISVCLDTRSVAHVPQRDIFIQACAFFSTCISRIAHQLSPSMSAPQFLFSPVSGPGGVQS